MENTILLWDHLADFVLSFSLKMSGSSRLYLGNLYDEKQVLLDVDEFDEVLSEMILSMLESMTQGNLVLEYSFDEEENLTIKITKINGKSSSF
ncbi:MAG: hypothetical protein HUJ97_05675 [Bacteroidales bacterium]|nr:hypothetical protein [Bacteroidales bacterium]